MNRTFKGRKFKETFYKREQTKLKFKNHRQMKTMGKLNPQKKQDKEKYEKQSKKNGSSNEFGEMKIKQTLTIE